MRVLLVLVLLFAAGCADSHEPPGDPMSACFERRQLEDWDELAPGSCTQEHDADADGTIDSAFYSVFDGLGRLIESGVTGEHPELEVKYNDRVHTTTTTRYALDGTVEKVTVERADQHGNVLEQRSDYGESGDRVTTLFDYSCWPETPARLWPGPCSVRTDYDADGDADLISSTEWDEQGRETRIIEHNFYADASLSIVIEHADDGSWERSEHDERGDGTIDRISGVEYDADGRQLRSWIDEGADGTDEWVVENAYDREGRVIFERHVTPDYLETRSEWAYEDGGRLAIETASPSSFVPFSTERHIRFDRAGNIVAEAIDANEDGAADYCTYYSYSCLFEGP